MSDITGGGPFAASGYGRPSNNGGTRAQTGPVPVGSPAGIKGPREIMRERAAREAQRRADQEATEALEQRRADEEQRLIDLENRRNVERRPVTTGVSTRPAARLGSNTGTAPASGLSDQLHRSEMTSNPDNIRSGSQVRAQGRSGTVEETIGNPRLREGAANQGRQMRQPEVPKTSTKVPQTSDTARAEPGSTGPPSDPTERQPETAPLSRRVTRSSFPHAFERWETLSAHWEGLTSYWVRRLEENSTEINKDPLSQQMSRQITDLSAAGANLFHAVVELQRLRASSERKFQRWFFETKQQETEIQKKYEAMENALQDERSSKARAIEDAVNAALAVEKENFNSHKITADARREINIAREEARRAWEELGRREQEERDRTLSLRDGQPTMVGGVQVVPMMQGVTSRHSSARAVPPLGSERPTSGPSVANPSDPFMDSRPAVSSARSGNALYTQHPATSAGQVVSLTAPFYQQHQGPVPHTEDPTGRDHHNRSYNQSEPYSEEEYVIDSEGQYRRDSQGNKIRFPGGPASDIMEEYDAVHEQIETPPVENDYAGEGYGADWDAVRTHHHPTRLSDVLEEDERSRTSASQLSRN